MLCEIRYPSFDKRTKAKEQNTIFSIQDSILFAEETRETTQSVKPRF